MRFIHPENPALLATYQNAPNPKPRAEELNVFAYDDNSAIRIVKRGSPVAVEIYTTIEGTEVRNYPAKSGGDRLALADCLEIAAMKLRRGAS